MKTSGRNRSFALTLAALGVVFGDIGTSPLYAMREAFHGPHAIEVTPDNILGVLSLMIWTLIVVVSGKYLLFVMRADNKGEGGELALTALATPTRILPNDRRNRFLLLLGLFGAALLFGDGILTPPITILGAVEGLQVATPMFNSYVVPITILILIGLFFSQHHGTGRIGLFFGPVIFIWFVTIGGLGLKEIVTYPEIFLSLNPYYGFNFFLQNGWAGFVTLGSVFLVVTGTEALYADMGHFGRKPIQRAWFSVVFPGLIFNYMGQGALMLRDPSKAFNPFYNLAPEWFLYPLVFIATLAAIIASQALISGVFSLTRQAIQLGYFPRIKIVHTSTEEIGQIYVPQVNWALLVLTIWVVIEFRSSSNLTSAYGFAVACAMIISTILTCAVARNQWRWKLVSVLSVLILFLTIDVAFFGANMIKFLDGGWLPLMMGAIIFTLMTTWKRGRQILMSRLKDQSIPISEFIRRLEANPPARVEGTAVFMTGDPEGTPPALLHNVKHNKVLHERVALLTVASEEIPTVSKEGRVEIETLGENFYRITAFYGFMESPNIVDILEACGQKGVPFDLSEITFFLGRETLLPSPDPGMPIWREVLFSFMSKNAERATSFFNIPPDQVVEVGIQIKI